MSKESTQSREILNAPSFKRAGHLRSVSIGEVRTDLQVIAGGNIVATARRQALTLEKEKPTLVVLKKGKSRRVADHVERRRGGGIRCSGSHPPGQCEAEGKRRCKVAMQESYLTISNNSQKSSSTQDSPRHFRPLSRKIG